VDSDDQNGAKNARLAQESDLAGVEHISHQTRIDTRRAINAR